VRSLKWIIAGVLALLVSGVSSARADLPVRRISGFVGLRQNFGGLGNDFRWGTQLIGAEAAWLAGTIGDDFRWGGVWWVQISRYVYPEPGSVNPELGVAEMGLGPRLDWRLPFEKNWLPSMAHAQVSFEWYRASNPIPPDNEITYYGGQLKVGLEWGSPGLFYGIAVTSSLLPWMPASATLLASIGVGGD
jgi:hypothetical protein